MGKNLSRGRNPTSADSLKKKGGKEEGVLEFMCLSAGIHVSKSWKFMWLCAEIYGFNVGFVEIFVEGFVAVQSGLSHHPDKNSPEVEQGRHSHEGSREPDIRRPTFAKNHGLSRVFSLSRNSALSKKGLENDKLANRRPGQRRPFHSGFFVITGGVRGDPVIRPLFYYFFPRATGACPSRASEVPRLRASLAARATASRLQKLTSASPDDAPGGPLSSGAARSINR
uniref:Uncharacterized protein n=1 Tax=Salix viminalis TaxID=40686 RepID=A0A6N2MMZ8_SALVM